MRHNFAIAVPLRTRLYNIGVSLLRSGELVSNLGCNQIQRHRLDVAWVKFYWSVILQRSMNSLASSAIPMRWSCTVFATKTCRPFCWVDGRSIWGTAVSAMSKEKKNCENYFPWLSPVFLRLSRGAVAETFASRPAPIIVDIKRDNLVITIDVPKAVGPWHTVVSAFRHLCGPSFQGALRVNTLNTLPGATNTFFISNLLPTSIHF